MLINSITNKITQENMSLCWVLIYLKNQVLIGKYENGALHIYENGYDESLLIEVHIFNKDMEFRAANDLIFRKIDEPKDLETYSMDEYFYILGNDIQHIEKEEYTYSKFSQYGREIIIPGKFQLTGKNSHNIRLHVRHIFDEKEGYLAGYRLVEIGKEKK